MQASEYKTGSKCNEYPTLGYLLEYWGDAKLYWQFNWLLLMYPTRVPPSSEDMFWGPLLTIQLF